MVYQVKITTIGNSAGIILPKEILALLNVEKGDNLFFTRTPQGFTISPHDDETAKAIAIGREFMREYRDTFEALAK